MGNFYRDNKDIENVIDLLDLTEVATLLEEDFKFAKEYDFAPKDAADAIDNYKRAIDLCGDRYSPAEPRDTCPLICLILAS